MEAIYTYREAQKGSTKKIIVYSIIILVVIGGSVSIRDFLIRDLGGEIAYDLPDYYSPSRVRTVFSTGEIYDSLTEPNYPFFFGKNSTTEIWQFIQFDFILTNREAIDLKVLGLGVMEIIIIPSLRNILTPELNFSIYPLIRGGIETIDHTTIPNVDDISCGNFSFHYYPLSQKHIYQSGEHNFGDGEVSLLVMCQITGGYGEIVLNPNDVQLHLEYGSYQMYVMVNFVFAIIIGITGISCGYIIYKQIRIRQMRW